MSESRRRDSLGPSGGAGSVGADGSDGSVGSVESDKMRSLAASARDAAPLPARGPTLGAVYRFALRPRWVLSHVLVAALVVLMVLLGLWQLRRLDERQDRNALITARVEEPVAPLAEIIDVDGTDAAAERARYRRVEASGAFEPGSDVIVRNRTEGGQPGSWLLAVLRLDDGGAVLVNRGWVPVTGDQEPPTDALAPSGSVLVEGTVQTTQERGRFGSVDPVSGRLGRVARVDVDRLAEQVDGEVYPIWIQLERAAPPQGDLPVPVEPPVLDEGRHFGYAMQWFAFSLIAIIGYPLVLRRVARQSDPGSDGPPPVWDDGALADSSPDSETRLDPDEPGARSLGAGGDLHG